MPANDPQTRSLIAQRASHSSWGRPQDRTARTAPGRAAYKAKRDALRAKLLAEADGDEAAAASGLKAHDAKVKLLAVQARSRVVEAAKAAEAAEAELRSFGLGTE
jgi:hypothetical protein